MYTLYGGGVTCAIGPQMVLEEGGLPYDFVVLDEHADDHRKPAYLSLNPAGYIPALVTPEGQVLHEATAIMVHLAERHDLWDLIPQPADALRGLFFCRLFYQTNDIVPAARRFFRPNRYTADPTQVDAIRNRAATDALNRWVVLDTYLNEDGPYLLGDRFSLLDLHMTLWAAYGLETPDAIINRFAGVRRCFELTARRTRVAGLITQLQSDITVWMHKETA